MINWQVIGQVFSTGLLFFIGPTVILYYVLKKGKL